MKSRTTTTCLTVVIAAFAGAAALLSAAPQACAATPTAAIQHVIFIMQENRSFDNYFGTYPGADGFPAGTCQPIDPAKPTGGCIAPYHDVHDVNQGGPHGASFAQLDLDDGITTAKMDGFISSQTFHLHNLCTKTPSAPICTSVTGFSQHDVMGYHTAEEIPSYWAYAKHFVLQDRLFEGVRGQSLQAHLDMTSEWAAICTNYLAASTCTSSTNVPNPPKHKGGFPWVSLFQLLDANSVSWKYYLSEGLEPDCDDDAGTCSPQIQSVTIHTTWNPAPAFNWVRAQGPAYLQAHNPVTNQLLVDVNSGTLPQVSWVVPNDVVSEHPNRGITQGEQYVTSIVNAVMQSQYWANTAIFISWDDWGGFYDHVVPPIVDMNASSTPVQGFGIRVPGLLISAYAKPGYIDHQLLSFDSYTTFFEDLFMGGQRLDPAAFGNPDARPTQRDSLQSARFIDGHTEAIGNLMNEFDFTQKPLPPLVLPAHVPTGIIISCRTGPRDFTASCTKKTILITWNPLNGPEITTSFIYHITRDGVDLPQCTTTASTCTDTAPAGVHYYRAYSVDAAGVVSPPSAAAEADAL